MLSLLILGLYACIIFGLGYYVSTLYKQGNSVPQRRLEPQEVEEEEDSVLKKVERNEKNEKNEKKEKTVNKKRKGKRKKQFSEETLTKLRHRNEPTKPTKPTKKKPTRKWGEEEEEPTEEELMALDWSQTKTEKPLVLEYTFTLPSNNEYITMCQDDLKAWRSQKKTSLLFSLLSTLVERGKTVLSKKTIQPVLKQIEHNLLGRNVPQAVTESLCVSVQKQLLDFDFKKKESLEQMVRTTMKTHVRKTLMDVPDLLGHIQKHQEQKQKQKQPFIIVFVGVNGVGKTTSLAKVATYFKSSGLKVGLAACDTFRTGAVEQLRTHAQRLEIEKTFYCSSSQQTNPSASDVAEHAVKQASQDHCDVLLIDTAGRMQNNRPLMASLEKLVRVNAPDLILFVGDGLAGSDLVDQAQEFNRALIDRSQSKEKNPHSIDGLILTKFDAADKCVGSALSLVHVTKKPIYFIGIGQTYCDLRQPNLDWLVDTLLE